MAVREDVSGYVLAGGRSRRMGRDKAMVRFRGQTLIERALATMRQVAADVAIVGDRPDLATFAEVIPDVAANVGPLAGLVAGAAHCKRTWAVFMPVDVPLLGAEVLAAMVEAAERADALCLVPLVDDEPQPLCVVLHGTVHDALEQQLVSGERKVMRAFEGAAGSRLVLMPMRGVERFTNMNTPEDLAEFAEYDGGEALSS